MRVPCTQPVIWGVSEVRLPLIPSSSHRSGTDSLFLAQGGNVITVTSECIGYGILDLLMTVCFVFFFLYNNEGLDYDRFEFVRPSLSFLPFSTLPFSFLAGV